MDSQELQKLKNRYDIIGNDAALNRALETAVAIAPTDLTVLITGESGVGKENIPKIIHQNSRRRNGKYFAVNCGAIPEGTIDSELFGHEKGSFTGATETRKGYFQEADGGTLFLDEIGELPLSSQAKLLRVLQSGEFIKVGSSKVEKTDVRVVAATNKNLLHAVGQGKFREDLYYRLNVIPIKMPALRERRDDIYLLFRKFSSDFSEKYETPRIALTNDAIDLLIGYRWPGNVRQLKNVAETVTALEGGRSENSGRVTVDAPALSRYIPRDEPNMLPVKAEAHDEGGMSSSDKQMFIKAILDLRDEVEALKKVVYGQDPSAVKRLPRETVPDGNDAEWQGQGAPVSEDELGSQIVLPSQEEPEEQVSRIADEQDSREGDLSVANSRKELVIKALEKNGGNRKLAADELGISERTLYRWIDRFGL